MLLQIRWQNILIGVLVLLSILLNIMFLHMINILDFSTQKPLQTLSTTNKPDDFYLLTYADGRDVYFQNRNLLTASAINRGFDFILNYRRDHIDANYIKQHPILQQKIGAGYWLWKPYLILKTLQNIPDGAIVMYADSGLVIRQPMQQYLNKQFAPNKDILAFAYNQQLHGVAATIASGDTFLALNCMDESCRNGHHVWAGMLALRNSKQSRDFIQEWLKYCEQDQILQGISLNTPNYPEFTHHQHDEAILSVLVNREAAIVNFVPMDSNFYQHIKVHRRKTSEQSLIAFMSSRNIDHEYVLQDIWPIKKLRSFMQKWTVDKDS
jgi:hypothetical protein